MTHQLRHTLAIFALLHGATAAASAQAPASGARPAATSSRTAATGTATTGTATTGTATTGTATTGTATTGTATNRPAATSTGTKPTSSTGATQAAPAASGQAGATATETDDDDAIRAGHSYHGEAFDDGPRQAAYLMPGMGNVVFQVTTKSPEAQKFFNQGVAQLHGFWYFEAERSFRQAAALDPDCAMAYWGMALANVNNTKRAEKFIAEAAERREKASRREQLWIDAWSTYYKTTVTGKDGKPDTQKDKDRKQALVRAIENIVHEYPDDVEAKAYLVLHIWSNRGQIPLGSNQAVDALIDQIFDKNPMHPAHHYRIHLWDDSKAIRALKSAALGGQSQPGTAHMWHMPGHTFSKLQRYADAAWQQEAASRTDHAYMMRDRVIPDQIHNYAHNHEWLIRDLIMVGRARYAAELARNLIEMPRHPKYNSLGGGASQRGPAPTGTPSTNTTQARTTPTATPISTAAKTSAQPSSTSTASAPTGTPQGTTPAAPQTGRTRSGGGQNGSAQYGRSRLVDVYQKFELWSDLIAAANSPYLEPTDSSREQLTRLRTLGTASYEAGDTAAGKKMLAEIEALLAKEEAAQKKAVDKAEADANQKKLPADKVTKAKNDAMNPFRAQVASLQAAAADVRARALIHEKKYADALVQLKKAGITGGDYLARINLLAGNKAEAEKLARAALAAGKNQVVPLANAIYVLAGCDKTDEAKKLFGELRTLAAAADLDVPPLERLAPLAARWKFPADWRTPEAPKTDIGVRPSLESLGPIRWEPSPAPAFQLTTLDGKSISLADYRGRPVVLVFYLGSGCLHCTEQLKTFAAAYSEFKAAGLEILAVSSDSSAALRTAQEQLKASEKYPFPIVSNEDTSVFKKYRTFDDFEKLPLHGTFLVDGQGKLRWLDIGPEPFMDAKFLITESKRLLSLPGSQGSTESKTVRASE
jgi:peroxiredoxin